MSTDESIDEEAVEAAAAAISSKVCPGRPWGDTDDADKPHYRDEARAALAAAVPALERQLRDKIAEDEIVKELRELWQRALEREGNLASAVADVMWKATQFGETETGDTAAYLVPKGAMHRLIGVAQQNGAHVPVSFRATTGEAS